MKCVERKAILRGDGALNRHVQFGEPTRLKSSIQKSGPNAQEA